MENEVAVLWVVVSGVAGLMVGMLIAGVLARSGKLQKGKLAELRLELTEKEEELSQYKQQVYAQFADTADKFKALDESYHALHRQLASSSVALCGDQATELLTANTTQRLADEVTVVDAQDISDAAETLSEESIAEIESETPDPAQPTVEIVENAQAEVADHQSQDMTEGSDAAVSEIVEPVTHEDSAVDDINKAPSETQQSADASTDASATDVSDNAEKTRT